MWEGPFSASAGTTTSCLGWRVDAKDSWRQIYVVDYTDASSQLWFEVKTVKGGRRSNELCAFLQDRGISKSGEKAWERRSRLSSSRLSPVKYQWNRVRLISQRISRSKQSKRQLFGLKSTERAAAAPQPALTHWLLPAQPSERGESRRCCRGAVDYDHSEQHVNYNIIYFSPFPWWSE